MAKLYFYYSAMNAGKSTILLQSAYNYKEKGMETLLFTPAIDSRFEKGKIHSRIGLSAEAVPFTDEMNLLEYTESYRTKHTSLACVLIDEAQFLTKKQVAQLTDIVDKLNLPVLAYGLRSDFRGEPFEGSLYLLIWADHLSEIKTICHCGRKAIMSARIDAEGRPVKSGEQVMIGGNESYIALCRKHFKGMA
ncbi:thymidine kinase [Aquicella lusitana]|uniref:Thymidine kinase n=1 Tax=Aquicella lusitana TaxID=254246 RepID=A0A370GFC5_9COXI|nr:thymidine kinase [Aquicella lusitana]RDI41809.1 thymidine kinase [Aquicella lusitana]VVC73717.1 Thymidine kinase [Aquicella lusitana]